MTEIRTIELFGGIGAPAAALRNLGVKFNPVDYVEIDPKPVTTYNAMFDEELKKHPSDVRDYRPEIDIMIHGSPCQDVSIAGLRKGNDEGSETRSSLMWETLRIIRDMGECKPKVVIWENVKGVLHKSMRKNFDKYLKEMEELGYTNSFDVLDARDFGLPQARERMFCVSIQNGIEFDFHKLERKPMVPIQNFLEDLDEPGIYKLCPSMYESIGQPKKGSNFKGYAKIIDQECCTITTAQDRIPNSGVIKCKNGDYRVLTERECWRLMGFSDDEFEKALKVHPGRKGKKNGTLYKQSGNSIPVPILESMLSLAIKYIEKGSGNFNE